MASEYPSAALTEPQSTLFSDMAAAIKKGGTPLKGFRLIRASDNEAALFVAETQAHAAGLSPALPVYVTKIITFKGPDSRYFGASTPMLSSFQPVPSKASQNSP